MSASGNSKSGQPPPQTLATRGSIVVQTDQPPAHGTRSHTRTVSAAGVLQRASLSTPTPLEPPQGTPSTVIPETPPTSTQPSERILPSGHPRSEASVATAKESLNNAKRALERALELLHGNHKTISAKRLADATAEILDEAMHDLQAVEAAAKDGEPSQLAQPPASGTLETKLVAVIEKGIKSIQATIAGGTKTWAKVAAMAPHTRTQAESTRDSALRSTIKERSQYEVTLNAKDTPNNIKAKIAEEQPAAITAALQRLISDTIPGTVKPTINGIAKLANGNLKLQFITTEDAEKVRTTAIDWTVIYQGVKMHKPNYGIVVHGIPTDIIDLEANYSETAKLWSEQNQEINILRITPLRRKTREPRRPQKHHSIVVFTENKAAANHCIKFGFFVDRCRYKTERYTPHLHLNQCFRCYGFGHKALTCKNRQRCGRCSNEGHNSNECNHPYPTCANCKGEHESWQPRCPSKVKEQARLRDLENQTPPLYL
jgi:hypothetical protein